MATKTIGQLPLISTFSGDTLIPLQASGVTYHTTFSDMNINLGGGWARYDDNQYTSGSPLTVTADTVSIVLPNNGATTIETYMNSTTSFYNSTTQKVQMEKEGDVYSMVVVFKAQTNNASQAHFELSLTSTGPTPYERVSNSYSFAKGNDTPQNFYSAFNFYGDLDFVTNGNQWKISSFGADVLVYDIIYFIQRTYRNLI